MCLNEGFHFLQGVSPYLKEASEKLRNFKTTKEYDVSVPGENVPTTFSDPGPSVDLRQYRDREGHDFDFLLDALWRQHPALKRIWKAFENRTNKQVTRLQTFLESNRSDLTNRIRDFNELVLNDEPIISSITTFKTMRRSFHMFRTFQSQAQGKYNCGVVSEFFDKGGNVCYFGEALQFLIVEIAGKNLALCKVRWFDPENIVEHRLRPGIPIVRKPLRYIKDNKPKQYSPFVSVDLIQGGFFVGDYSFPRPCEDHTHCRKTLGSSKRERQLVPCLVKYPKSVLFPWLKWERTPKNQRSDMGPVSEVIDFGNKLCKGLTLIRHSHIQSCLKFDKVLDKDKYEV